MNNSATPCYVGIEEDDMNVYYPGLLKRIESGDVQLIDVRNPDEIKQSGKIGNSYNIPGEVNLFVCLFCFWFVCLFDCLIDCLFVCLHVCFFVCMFVFSFHRTQKYPVLLLLSKNRNIKNDQQNHMNQRKIIFKIIQKINCSRKFLVYAYGNT